MSDSQNSSVTGVILAGGRATRMGGQDKGLIELSGRPMVEYIIDILRPQVKDLLINANRHMEEYAKLGRCPVFRDDVEGFAGPLAGMASALQRTQSDYLLTVPCAHPRA